MRIPTIRRRTLIRAAILLAILATILTFWWNHTFRNFHTVEPGVLYRSGQLSKTGFDLTLRAYRIKTVVTLRTVRDPESPYLDEWEADVCKAHGARHVRILPRQWMRDANGHLPAEESVKEFLAVLDDPSNYPVLVHCFAGVHRTGVMCALFRMREQHWSADRAIAEMEKYGFEPGPEREDIEAYLRACQSKWNSSPVPK